MAGLRGSIESDTILLNHNVVLLFCSSCERAAAVHYFQIYLTFLGGSTIKPHGDAVLCGGDRKFKLEMATYSGVFFFHTWVRFAREGKAVALQYHE